MFNALADKFAFQTTKNREVSAAKNLGFHDNSFDKSLIYIKNHKRTRTEPCGTPALTVDHLETCPFKTTLP